MRTFLCEFSTNQRQLAFEAAEFLDRSDELPKSEPIVQQVSSVLRSLRIGFERFLSTYGRI